MNAPRVIQGHFLLADTSAFDAGYRVGHVCGQIFDVLLFFLPALYCLATLRRPGTNVKCLLSLALALLAFLLCGLVGAVARNSPELRSLGFLAGLGALGMMIAALVLAIIGLVEYYGRARQYTRGAVQAIITLVLCAIFGGLVVFGAFVSLTRPRPQAESLRTQ